MFITQGLNPFNLIKNMHLMGGRDFTTNFQGYDINSNEPTFRPSYPNPQPQPQPHTYSTHNPSSMHGSQMFSIVYAHYVFSSVTPTFPCCP